MTVAIVVVNPRTGARSEQITALAGTTATLTGLAVDPVQRRLLPTDFLLC
jgi:hypothetical protein